MGSLFDHQVERGLVSDLIQETIITECRSFSQGTTEQLA